MAVKLEIPLAELWPLLDRNALYRANWGARGLTGPAWEQLKREFDERLAQMWLHAEDYLHPQALYALFPAHGAGETMMLYAPQDAQREVARFTFPRQPGGRRLCLADYVPPRTEAPGVVGLQVVTVGADATERYLALEAAGEYSEAYFLHGLAAQVTEAAAEWTHRRVNAALGLPPEVGKRYSWGYPPCPDVKQHAIVWALLEVEAQLGLRLTEAGQIVPEHSTAALVIPNPQAEYFAMGGHGQG